MEIMIDGKPTVINIEDGECDFDFFSAIEEDDLESTQKINTPVNGDNHE